MTEIYCWTNIKCSIDGEHEENIEFVLKTIKDNFSNLFRDKLVDIKIINANYIIIATTCSNHYSDDVREIIKMFYTISQIALKENKEFIRNPLYGLSGRKLSDFFC